jgi:hypothetical protein
MFPLLLKNVEDPLAGQAIDVQIQFRWKILPVG